MQARSGRGIRRGGIWFQIVFGGLFTLAGFGALYFICLGPWMRQQRASDWKEVPCKVHWSRVRSHSGDDSTTYSVEVLYEYEYDEEVHRSNRYSFVSGSSSGKGRKSDIVKKYPKGHESTCFVNPAIPESAVLTRELDQVGWWWLFPLPFLGVGLAVLVGAIKGNLK